jgi:hypothetical protein
MTFIQLHVAIVVNLQEQVNAFWKVLDVLPIVNVSWTLSSANENGEKKKEKNGV